MYTVKKHDVATYIIIHWSLKCMIHSGVVEILIGWSMEGSIYVCISMLCYYTFIGKSLTIINHMSLLMCIGFPAGELQKPFFWGTEYPRYVERKSKGKIYHKDKLNMDTYFK